MTRFLCRWLTDDEGQDLIEYVLLGATVAFSSVLAMTLFAGVINAVYQGWDTATQNQWQPQSPASP